jgi:hypothetical protein
VGFNKDDRVAVEKLITLVSNFEKAIFASTGTMNRERGRWCNSVQRYGDAINAIQGSQRSRYHVLNLATHGKPTVEFRAFSATLNAIKLASYVRLCLALVERAITAKRTTNWTAKEVKDSSPIHRDGAGQTALTRLFYQLGWIKGRQPHTHGDLNAAGVPSLKQSKRELMRLARQYDAQANPAAVPVPRQSA